MLHKTKLLKRLSAALLPFAIVAASFAQGDLTQIGTNELLNMADSLNRQANYVESRPIMLEAITRLADNDTNTVKAKLEVYRFYLAYSYLQEFQAKNDTAFLKQAIEALEKYVSEYPSGTFALDSMRLVADCHMTLGDNAKSAQTLQKLLEPPFVERLSFSVRQDILKKIAEAYYKMDDASSSGGIAKKWELGEPWFLRLFDSARRRDYKVYAATCLMRTHINQKRYDDAMKYFPYMVYDYPSRYDIMLNIDFLNAGGELAKQGKFNLATLFYNMVYTKPQVLEGLGRYKERLETEFARLRATGNPANPRLKELEQQIKTYDVMIKTITEKVQDYTMNIMASLASNYTQTNRDYESFWSYWRLMTEFASDKSAEDFYFASFVGAAKIGKSDEMFKIGTEYLEKFPNGTYEADVVLRIAMYYLDTDQKELFYSTVLDYLNKKPDNERGNHFLFLLGRAWLNDRNFPMIISTFKKFEGSTLLSEGSYYWRGMAYLSSSDYPRALEFLSKVTDEFMNGDYREDAMFRKGVAAFGTGDMMLAKQTFETFLEVYPKNELGGEAEFFLGDIEGTIGNIDAARRHYMRVERKTTNQSFINNAYLQAVKLYSSAERYDEAIKMADRFIRKYPEENFGPYIYEKGQAYEKSARPADAIGMFLEAFEAYGNNPHDEGIDRMMLSFDSFYKNNLSRLQETVKFLEKAVSDKAFREDLINVPAKRYRFFQDNPNVDQSLYEKFKRDERFGKPMLTDTSLLKELLTHYKAQLDAYPQKDPVGIFSELLQKATAAGKHALELRCYMVLDILGKPVSVARVFGEDDFKNASVRALVWLGKQNEKYGHEAAAKAYEAALARDEYDFMIDAYLAMAALLEKQAQWEKARVLYAKAENDYPLDPRSGKAAIMQAEMLLKLKKNKAAIEKFEEIIKTPGWRGDIHAEVFYLLGKLAEESKKPDEAIMYYERAYLGLSNSYDWSGKSLLAAMRLQVASGDAEAITAAKSAADEFLANQKNRACKEYQEIESYRKTLN